MKSLLLFSIITIFIHFGCRNTVNQQNSDYDVIVVGATASGIAAAINSAREGADVVLTERTNHIGGLATGGLSNTDFITYESVGGTWREFMDRVVIYYEETYGPNSQQVRNCMDGGYYEPKVGLMILNDMLEEFKDNIDLLTHHRLEFAETRLKSDGFSQVEAIRVKDLESGKMKKLTGKVFIDGTYEGDLMAKAGCEYTIGSESQNKYDESIASKEANWHVQCYNFRPVLTKDSNNKLPIPKPEGYDREIYAPLVELIKSGKIDDLSEIIQDDRPLPNQKGDFNDEKGSPYSMRVCNPTDVWPEGNPETRQLVFDYIKWHNQGFIYFLQHDSELPDWVKEEMGQWGLPKDEFEETGHWPPVVYVREGRRMIGEYIFTQHDAQPTEGSVRAPAHENSVAIGDYALNSHGTHEPKPGVLKGELSGSTRPWQVPYGVMVPRKVDGLLVPVAVSASRAGYGAIRMEPTWTALGQAAGLAAAQALTEKNELRNISIPDLQFSLHELGAKTFYVSDVPPSSPYFKAVQFLGNRGLFQDLYEPEEATNWSREGIQGPPNHWSTAVPYHDIKPQLKMTLDLAENWLQKLGMKDKKLLSNARQMTRGEFLNKLYQKYQ